MVAIRTASDLFAGRLVICSFVLVWLSLPLDGRAAPALVYAPLPLENMTVTQALNQPLADLLGELLGRPVRLRLLDDHAALIAALASGEVDFAELGPLPFLLASEQNPDIRPLAKFRESDGRADYRCVIVAPIDGVASMDDLLGDQTMVTVALTQRQSTCGPSATFSLLAEHGFDLFKITAAYQGGHDDVAVAVLREWFTVGGMKENVARTFHGLGLRILTASDPVPGFVLAARADVLGDQLLQELSQSLINLAEPQLQGLQNGQHGFAEFEMRLFERVDSMHMRAKPFLDSVDD